MEIEKGKTVKNMREKRKVSSEVIENLKEFNRIKKNILESLREEESTIAQLSEKLSMPKHEIMYYVTSLVKFGFLQIGEIDDMDEYYSYKIKQ